MIGSLLAVSLVVASGGSTVYASKDVTGATLQIEVQQPVSNDKAAQIIEWVSATAATVSRTYGRFPNPAPRIVVIPVQGSAWGGNSGSAVIFGRVTRRNQETIELFVNADRPIEEYYADWTATHELSHLMLPLLSKRYRWISEGFATYYQNILMSRAGHYTPETAWRLMIEGFERGANSRPDLSLNDAAEDGIRKARMKIYWSGAAIALMADVELRRRSNGEESLDTVLGQLQECCLPSKRQWSGTRLFKKLDSFLETPLFMPLYQQHANSSGFPDFNAVIDDLGIVMTRNNVNFNERREHAGIRRAIESANPATN